MPEPAPLPTGPARPLAPGGAAGTGAARTRLEVEMAAHEGAIDTAHELVERLFAEHEDVSPRDRFRFETAVIEVLANIVEHAFTADDVAGMRRLTLCLAVTDTELVANLSDNGQPAGVDLGVVTMPEEDAESGRGLALALQAVDHLGYVHADGCNFWDLRCRWAT